MTAGRICSSRAAMCWTTLRMFSNRRYEEPDTVFRNFGNGKFEDVSAEAGPDFQKAAAHRGAAFGDSITTDASTPS